MLRQRILNSYSVFVGHIHPDVTRREICDLFKACGDLLEVVVLESERNSYNYGFVRYVDEEAAFKAIRELNHWPLKGVELVVDISKDTANRLKRERSGKTEQHTNINETSMGRKERQHEGPSKVSLFLQDTMYLNRLKENCVALHRKGSDGTGIVGADFLLDDISEATPSRFPSLWGTLVEPAVSFNNISQKIMQRCKKSVELDSSFGEKKAAEFVSSLEIIMKEIGDVIGAKLEQGDVIGAKLEQKSSKEEEGDKLDNVSEDDLVIKQCLEDIRIETEDSEKTLRIKSEIMNGEITKSKKYITRHRTFKAGDNFDWCSDDNDEEGLSESFIKHDLDTGSSSRVGCISKDDNLIKTSEIERSQVNSSITNNEQESSKTESGLYPVKFLDPAILDFHLSKLSEKEHSETKNEGQHSIINELFEKFRIRNQPQDSQLTRSLSQDSSVSSGSNEGNVDDSGVESDFTMMRYNQRGLPDMAMGYGRERMKGRQNVPAASVRTEQIVGIEDIVLKNMARGRGIKPVDVQQTKLPLGRGVLSLK